LSELLNNIICDIIRHLLDFTKKGEGIIMSSLFGRPTYDRIQIELPTPAGVNALPASIYFDIDTRFSLEQVTRIRVIIATLISSWFLHYEQTVSTGTSQWAACSNKYSRRNLSPLWRIWRQSTNGETALEYAMNVLTQRFRVNGTGRVIVPKIRYRIPRKGERLNMRSRTSFLRYWVQLNLVINPEILDDLGVDDNFLAGSLLHAWLHRCGYTHPRNIYTTYFIGEAPMCLMRGFQYKNPSVPDSTYTQYFN
jgi:hypothetical protein